MVVAAVVVVVKNVGEVGREYVKVSGNISVIKRGLYEKEF